MKSLVTAASAAVMLLLMLSAGCTLETPSTVDKRQQLGTDLIINEVFTISPDKYYAYSWIELYNPTPKKIKWADVTKPASGFAVGSGGEIIRTTDDGNHWNDSLTGSYGNLTSISLANPSASFACGDGGTLLRVSPSSVTVLTSGTTNNLHSIAAVPDPQNRTAFAVGDKGKILRTTDKGATWTAPVVPTVQNLRSVFFSAFNAIFAVGDSGTVVKSSNAGAAWQARIVPEPYRPLTFYSVNFVGALGWITGENGSIIASTNGGLQWLPETSNVMATLRAGFFPPPGSLDFPAGTGWIVGDSGYILKTTNNGARWDKEQSGVQASLNSAVFADSLHGWVFGDGGVILHTTNGGDSWRAQQSPATSNLHGSTLLPLLVVVSHNYVLEMVAQRRTFYIDPASGPNFNYFTKIDSGVLNYDPLLLVGFGFSPPPDIAPGAFAVIVSDSDKFKDHTNLGPGDGAVIPNSIGYYLDFNSPPGPFGFFHGVLWTLLPSSEIRLVKKFTTLLIATNQVLGTDSTVVDVVRWGNYRPTPDPWPNNVPAGFIPEWSSLARYSDDYGDILSRQNTSYSFYIAKIPIPRWYSQLSHKSR